MSLEVRWTEEAEVTFDTICSFIEDRWGEKTTDAFKRKTLKLLTHIADYPLLFPETGVNNIRKAVITKQSSVFYEVYTDRIVLIFFWDNRQDPLLF